MRRFAILRGNNAKPETHAMPATKPLRIFFSVGEPSGDLHAANLIRELRRRCGDFEAVGYGGPNMAEAGCQLHADLTALAVMWVARVVANLKTFWGLLQRADAYFAAQRPDAVVLIDYPGFNWWIARRAKARGIPVFYFSPPQIWAWATWRVKKMRAFVDHVLCCLPFEEAWFRERGCRATFVGHPFFDEVTRRPLDPTFVAAHKARGGSLVTILPGSRTQEVLSNLKTFLKAAALVHQAEPRVRFAIAAFKESHAEIARRQAAEAGFADRWTPDAPASAPPVVEVFTGKTPELMHLADCCMACSGSVSLELLYHTRPTVILYSISRFAYFVQKFFRKVKYITLVNLLSTGELYAADLSPYDPSQPDAEKVLFPEYLTCEDRSGQVASHIIEWLERPSKRESVVKSLARLKEQVAHEGASRHAAEYILEVLPHDEVPAPHHDFSQQANEKVIRAAR
jgi:lipid-A-disaccharide synthase